MEPLRVAVLALCLATVAPGQQQGQGEVPLFRTETALGLVRFHAVHKNRYVLDLRPDQIVLLEDGKPQKISLFEGGRVRPRSIPVEIVLVFDTSGSVTQIGLLDPIEIKRSLVDALAGSSVSIYRFSSRMQRLARCARSTEEVKLGFDLLLQKSPRGAVSLPLDQHASPKDRKHGIGGSPIFEAAMEAARDASSGDANTTRLLLIFSDGFATSDTRVEAAARYIASFGIPVYPVALGHHNLVDRIKDAQQRNIDSRGAPRPPSEHQRRLEMQEQEIQEFARLGELTGGRSFDPRSLTGTALQNLLQYMVGQVRAEYVVGYYPASSGGAKKKRKLEVRLASKDLGKIVGGTRILEH